MRSSLHLTKTRGVAVALAAALGWQLLAAAGDVVSELSAGDRPPWRLRLTASEAARIHHTLGEHEDRVVRAVRTALPVRAHLFCRSRNDEQSVAAVYRLRNLLYPIVVVTEVNGNDLLRRAQQRREPCFLLDLDAGSRTAPPRDCVLVARDAAFELWRYEGRR